MLKILIFGAGSVGTFLGTKLYAAGHQVVLYGRRKLDSLKQEIIINGEVYRVPPRCDRLQANDDYDAIFVTTKLYDTKDALIELKKYRLNPQIIVFIQNGIVEPNFYQGFQNHSGFTAVSIFNGYHFTDSQLLVNESHFGWQLEDSLAGQKVYRLFKEANIQCNITPNISQIRAKKLILNAAFNTLSAVEKKTIAQLVADQNSKKIVDGIIKEGWSVLKDDYHLTDLASLQKTIYEVIARVGEHYSSMYQDLVSGRKTEVEFLNGLIVRLGLEKGIPTPYNQQVYFELLDELKSDRISLANS